MGCDEPQVITKEVIKEVIKYVDKPIDESQIVTFTDALKFLGFKVHSKSYSVLRYWVRNNLQIEEFDSRYAPHLRVVEGDMEPLMTKKFIDIKIPNFGHKNGYAKLKKIVEWAESIPTEIIDILKE